MTLKGLCIEWKNPNRSGVGIFCSNLLRLRNTFPPVMRFGADNVSILTRRILFDYWQVLPPETMKVKTWRWRKRLIKRFWISRYGYHLMGITFECDLYQFINVNERDPIHENSRDIYTLLCIRRAILYSFWSWETIMVSGNFRRHLRYYFDSVEQFSIRRPVPIIVTNEFRDIVGMGCALQTLDTLRRKGMWQDQLQCYSMRWTPTWYTNSWGAGAGSSEVGAI